MPTEPVMNVVRGLRLASWRGIEFPMAPVLKTDNSQQIVVHKYPDRDGGKLDATGKDPRPVKFTATFRNGLVFARFNGGQSLFPETFSRFIAACDDRSNGTLVHPFYGELTGKIHTYNETIDGGKTDGADVECSFLEHTEDDAIGTPLPLSTAATNAADLDSALTPLPKSVTGAGFRLPPVTFSSLISAIVAVGDTVTLASSIVQRQIPNALHQVDLVIASCDKVKATALADTAPVRAAAVRLYSSLLAAQKKQTPKKTATFTTTYPITLGGLAAQLRANVTDLIALNAYWSSKPFVPANVPIRYYA